MFLRAGYVMTSPLLLLFLLGRSVMWPPLGVAPPSAGGGAGKMERFTRILRELSHPSLLGETLVPGTVFGP